MDKACELNDMELDAVSGGHGHGHGHRPETKYVFKDDTFNITNNGTVNGVNGIALGGQTFNFS
ncbi:hypothetical protein ACRQ5Q_09300 [Bradyrhizobium sp. PMVTL-01]|uniref:hypothetical protein n=1 Tax=Bradyrhizobium sp. PMVTL-01 TaxID=3434999 RepID=UPI003F6E62C4